MDLNGKVAIVSAASREIGAAIATTLAAAGCAVLATHYGEAELAETLAGRIRAAGGRVLLHEANLTTAAANRDLVDLAVQTFGRIDYLIANAGVTISAPFLETDEAAWDTLADLNIKGSFFAAQAAARAMVSQGQGGRIIFSSSVTGNVACPGLAAYGITKAALRHMAATLGAELGRYGITVNALGIGATLNARNLSDNPNYEADWDALIPTGRTGRPQDIADAVMFLLSPQAAMVNGHTLMIDGGWSQLGQLP
ncbi:MAG TPA: SDR family oxidoreductase [Roseiflexaceae bacterium]|nr:SDR family oxidoreductase [Roseiflexaceae bacterium]